jgi:glycosyltransferase involved in cell wall biosynthesis
MTCSGDVGIGGVQQVFRDLIHALETEQRRVELVYQAALPQLGLTRARNAWGREAFHCAMPTLVRNSVVFGLLASLVYLPLSLFHLIRLIRGHKIDAINCHYLTEYFLHLVIAGRLTRVPVVISVHGADVDRYASASRAQRFLLRLVMRGAHRVVGCSAAMARQTVQTFPSVASKVTYVHNGLDLAQFPAVPEPPAIATPFVLVVCRQVEKKGVDTLIRAFSLLERDFSHLSLVVVGDGPALGRNRALARALGIERRVVFTGDVPHAHVLRYFAACTVLAVPSRAEPFGLVILEGAYYKKAMVCTRVGGIPEIVADEVSALLVGPDDHVAMADRLAALLRDRALAGRLGVAAHQLLMKRFRWEDRVKDYIAMYDRAGEPLARDHTTLSAASFPSTAA